jgi:hypothetical protein
MEGAINPVILSNADSLEMKVIVSSAHTPNQDFSLLKKEEFSLLEVITFSATLQQELIQVLNAPNISLSIKLWTCCRLINNITNSESFFFLDFVISVGICVFNVVETSNGMTKRFNFATLGALIVNAGLLWYFCYCRSLSGKDVITLRRSIQLLNHFYQLSTIDILVVCASYNNSVVDDDVKDPHHIYYCTSYFLFVNYMKLIWHVLVLFKFVCDELLSGFLICRGVMLDLLSILAAPVLMTFSHLTDFCAEDLKNILIATFNINYEVNDITLKTAFYKYKLTNSSHQIQLNGSLYILIVQSLFSTSSFSTFYGPVFYDNQEDNYYFDWWEVFISVKLLCLCTGGVLMAEYYACRKNKFATIFVFLIAYILQCSLYMQFAIDFTSILLNQDIYSLGSQCFASSQNITNCFQYNYEFCYVLNELNYCSYSTVQNDISPTFFRYGMYESLAFIIVGSIILLIFLFQNRHGLIHKLLRVVPEYLAFIIFVTIFCPLLPFLQFLGVVKRQSLNFVHS